MVHVMDFAGMMRALMDERGLGVRALARKIPCDPAHISRLASGKQRPSRSVAQRLDAVLAAAGQLATLAPPSGNRQVPVICDDAETISVPCRTPDGRIIFVTVPRRLFLQQTGAAAVAAMTAGAGPRPPVPPPDAGSPAERFGLARKALRDLDNTSGPREVIPMARRHVAAMRQISRSIAGRDRRELMQVQIQFADLIGWLYQDSGDYETAGHWLDRALGWSHAAGDDESAAFILARKSQLAGDIRDAGSAVALAQAAARLAGRRSRVGAVAAAYGSYGHALAGDRAACERLCDQARATPDTRGDDHQSPWATFLDTAYVETGHARSLATLGDYPAAAGRFRDAIGALRPGYYRDRGVYLAREARAWAGAGEHEHAATLGTRALAIGTGTGSGRIFTELASLEHALTPAPPLPPVREFRDAMKAAVLRPA
jgi:tetratricopeptide (TPR) repeat protein